MLFVFLTTNERLHVAILRVVRFMIIQVLFDNLLGALTCLYRMHEMLQHILVPSLFFLDSVRSGSLLIVLSG